MFHRFGIGNKRIRVLAAWLAFLYAGAACHEGVLALVAHSHDSAHHHSEPANEPSPPVHHDACALCVLASAAVPVTADAPAPMVPESAVAPAMDPMASPGLPACVVTITLRGPPTSSC